MNNEIKIAVDAMGGDGSPKKVIDGIIHHYQNNKDTFYQIFGDKEKIIHFIDGKLLEIIGSPQLKYSQNFPGIVYLLLLFISFVNTAIS